MTMKFGLLVPHFGAEADPGKLREGRGSPSTTASTRCGRATTSCSSPTARWSNPTRRSTRRSPRSTAMGAVTERIELGTGSLIPFRHPIATALTVGTLTALVGDRVIIGMGAGTFDHEFDVIGMGDMPRVELVKSNAKILRRLFSEDDVSYADDHYQFEHVTIAPKPSKPVPFWYCGATPKSARLAAEYADGWMPGRTTLLTIEARAETMRQLTSENGRPMPTVAVIPPTSIADTTEQAWEGLNVDGPDRLGEQARQVVGHPAVRLVLDRRGHRGFAHRRQSRRGRRADPTVREGRRRAPRVRPAAALRPLVLRHRAARPRGAPGAAELSDVDRHHRADDRRRVWTRPPSGRGSPTSARSPRGCRSSST